MAPLEPRQALHTLCNFFLNFKFYLWMRRGDHQLQDGLGCLVPHLYLGISQTVHSHRQHYNSDHTYQQRTPQKESESVRKKKIKTRSGRLHRKDGHHTRKDGQLRERTIERFLGMDTGRRRQLKQDTEVKSY